MISALVYRALHFSNAPTVIFPFRSVYFVFFWFIVQASDGLVVFNKCAKFLSPTFEDKSLLIKEKIC